MKYSEAMKIVKQYPELSALVNRIRERTIEKANNDEHCAGSWQFSVDGECFYFGYESYLDERDGKYHAKFNGGKHTPWRSRQLLERGETWIVR